MSTHIHTMNTTGIAILLNRSCTLRQGCNTATNIPTCRSDTRMCIFRMHTTATLIDKP